MKTETEKFFDQIKPLKTKEKLVFYSTPIDKPIFFAMWRRSVRNSPVMRKRRYRNFILRKRSHS